MNKLTRPICFIILFWLQYQLRSWRAACRRWSVRSRDWRTTLRTSPKKMTSKISLWKRCPYPFFSFFALSILVLHHRWSWCFGLVLGLYSVTSGRPCVRFSLQRQQRRQQQQHVLRCLCSSSLWVSSLTHSPWLVAPGGLWGNECGSSALRCWSDVPPHSSLSPRSEMVPVAILCAALYYCCLSPGGLSNSGAVPSNQLIADPWFHLLTGRMAKRLLSVLAAPLPLDNRVCFTLTGAYLLSNWISNISAMVPQHFKEQGEEASSPLWNMIWDNFAAACLMN